MNKLNSKILLVDNGFIGKNKDKYYFPEGTSKFVEDLKNYGFDISLLSFVKKIDLNENILGFQISETLITTSFNDKNIFLKFFSYIKIILKLLNRIYKYDFIYVFYPGNINYLTILLALIFKRKYGIYVRGELKYNLPFLKNILSKANLIVTNNPIIQKQLLSYNDNTKMIISYQKLGNEVPNLPNKFIKKNINSKSPFKLLYVGRVEYKKGIVELIDACILLIENKINFKLVIVGGGELYKSLKDKINNDLILKDYIELVGLVKDKERLKSYYLSSDLFVFPSHSEGFPRVLFDAMLNNLPIITTMIGGIPGFMKHEYNCLEIKVNNAHDIYNKIILLHNNKVLVNKLQSNSFGNLSNIFKKDLELHKNLIKNTVTNTSNK